MPWKWTASSRKQVASAARRSPDNGARACRGGTVLVAVARALRWWSPETARQFFADLQELARSGRAQGKQVYLYNLF